MSFDKEAITFNHSIKVGLDEAAVKVVEYINLRCPDSRDYELNVAPVLDSYIKEGKVQRIIKHFDKKSLELEKGSLMNQYLNYEEDEKTSQMIHQLFQEQNAWARNRISQIPHLANDYGLKLEDTNQKRALQVMEEIEAVGVDRIPTVFVGDHAFVEHIGLEEFKKEIEAQLL